MENTNTDVAISLDEVRAYIDGMIGADDFKRAAKELCQVASLYKETKNSTVLSSLFRRNYLYRIADGWGFTKSGHTVALILRAAGLSDVSLSEFSIERDDKGRFGSDGPEVFLLGDEKCMWQVKCIDISKVASMTGMPGFRKIMRLFYDMGKNCIFIFRVKNASDYLFSKVFADIADVMFTEKLDFKPIDEVQTVQYASSILKEYGLDVGSETFFPIIAACHAEKRDGKFYGFKTISKVIDSIIFNDVLSNPAEYRENGSVRSIGPDSIAADKSTQDAADESADKKLAELVGLENVKREINDIVGQIAYFSLHAGNKMPCVHMQFVGPPGTGKTTVARIVGQMLAERGVLSKGAFFEYSARQLCGRYIGASEYITAEVCRDAYGSVLFIDEAYALYKGEDDEKDFGKEVLNTLITEMENNRSDLLVILAGYEKDMENLMKMNSGLESRVPYKIVFSSYSKTELADMFMSMAEKDFPVSEGFEGAAREYFDSMSDDYISSETFGNGRYVRNLYERVRGKAISRAAAVGENIVLCEEDIAKAVGDIEFSASKGKADREGQRIGFSE